MGQKVNPHGLRVGVIKDWDSRWFARDNAFGDILVEDYKLRKFLKKTLYDAASPRSRSSVMPPESAFTFTAPVPAWSSARAAPRSRSSVWPARR